MRYITVPEDVVLENLRNQKTGEPPTLAFADYVRGTLVTHPRVTESNDTIKNFREIAESVKGLKGGATWEISEEHFELLSQFAKTFQYDPNVKLNVLDLIHAITSATTKKVEAENGEPKKKKTTEDKPSAEA